MSDRINRSVPIHEVERPAAMTMREALRNRALKMIRDGFTQRAISAAIGVPESTISQWKHRDKVKDAAPKRVELPESIRMLQSWPKQS